MKPIKIIAALLATIAWALPAAAQFDETAKRFHIFPHIADGGGWFSVLLVTNASPADSRCTFNVYGISLNRFASLPGVPAAGSTTTLQLEGNGGYLTWPTRGVGSEASGYATLDCSADVTAQIIFGSETGWATVFSAQTATEAQFLILSSQVTLAFAIANHTNANASCNVILEDRDRTNLGEARLSIPARSNKSQLLNSIISIPSSFAGGSAVVSCDREVAMLGLLFILRPNGAIVTFTTLPPAVLSTTPVTTAPPTEPSSRERAERLRGTWVFTYQITSRETRTYRLHTVFESSDEELGWVIGGTDEFEEVVVAGYSTTLKAFVLYDETLSFVFLFAFNFTGQNTVAGCLYASPDGGNSYSSCYDMTGTRTSGGTLSSRRPAPGRRELEEGATPVGAPSEIRLLLQRLRSVLR